MLEIDIIRDAFDIYGRHYHSLGDYSATTIIDSPRRVELFRRYGMQVEHTPESQAASLIGTAVHEKVESLLRQANILKPNYIVEKSMAIPWPVGDDGHILLLGGKPDIVVPDNKALIDIKTCKTWKLIFDPEMVEWTEQTNVYRFMLNEKGIDIDKIYVVAFLLDWVENQALRNPAYPKSPILEFQLPVWELEETDRFITERIEKHYDCQFLQDEHLPYCTKEQMWENPVKFAVMKDQNAKRAMKVLHDATNLNEAIEMAKLIKGVNSNSYIEIRHQARKRCDRYCAVNEWCNQYQEYRAAGGGDKVDRFELGGVI